MSPSLECLNIRVQCVFLFTGRNVEAEEPSQRVLASRNTGCHNLSNLLNSQESGLKVNQPASFAIRLNGAKGKIDAKVHSPSGAVEECHVSELEPGKQQGWQLGLGTRVSGSAPTAVPPG